MSAPKINMKDALIGMGWDTHQIKVGPICQMTGKVIGGVTAWVTEHPHGFYLPDSDELPTLFKTEDEAWSAAADRECLTYTPEAAS